ncbi:MAG: outer membrane protein assembly factor BamD [Phycisphaerae bacterium]
MYKEWIPRILVLLTVFLLAGQVFSATTLKLEQGQDWKEVTSQPEDKYSLAVSELKMLVSQGKSEQIAPTVAMLKAKYPEINTPDFDLFVEAEWFYAEDKITHAVRAYDTLLSRYPQSPLYFVALDRQYSIAKEYLGGRKKPILKVFRIAGYSEGVKIMDRVIDRAGNSPLGLKASRTIAESYESRGKYEEAYERWSEVSSKWPLGEPGKEALLSMARCKHAAYRGPDYDVSALVSAKSYYENFRQRYPEEAKQYEIDKRLEQIRQQIAYKEYKIGEFYQRTGNKQSSDIYANMIVGQWPDTIAARGARDILDKNQQPETKKAKKK